MRRCNAKRGRTQKEPRLTGQVLGKAILNVIESCNLPMNAAVGQSYDGASVMSSTTVGASAYVKEQCPFADYYHCSAHSLNLVLVHASKLPAIRDMISTVKKITTFLKKSNKKKITLQAAINLSSRHNGSEGLQSLCETRWVERVTALERFVSNYVPIVRTLMSISGWKDSEAKANALGQLKMVTSSTFIVSWFTCIAVTANIDLVSKSLQEKDTCLRVAMGHIENIIATLKDDRIHSKQRFTTIFKWSCDSIAILQLEIEKPRISSTSVYR